MPKYSIFVGQQEPAANQYLTDLDSRILDVSYRMLLHQNQGDPGKLISYQGGNDTVEIPGAIFDYYETVEKTMGGRAATQDFFRLFTVPGMNHCTGGDGVFAFDYLSYMEAWVEKGQPPDVMIGAHVVGAGKDLGWMLKYPLDPSTPIAFTRPVYPYPLHAKYKGKGDPNTASSFVPVGH